MSMEERRIERSKQLLPQLRELYVRTEGITTSSVDTVGDVGLEEARKALCRAIQNLEDWLAE